jgi:hypothetical protein
MSKDFTIDQRLDNVDSQLLGIDKCMDERFDEMNKQFDKIAAVVIKGFERVDKTLDVKADKADLQRIYDLLDKIAKKQEIDDDERLVIGHQLERLDHWVHEVANRIGYELTA